MVTIEVGTKKLECPTTWAETAKRLGVSKQTLDGCRSALCVKKEPISPELYELLRQATEFAGRRNTGGGHTCTYHEFARLRLYGGLKQRLIQLRIIGETHE